MKGAIHFLLLVALALDVSASVLTFSGTTTQTAGGGGGDWQLASGHYETAKIPLEIIAPRAALSTTNRYYRAYPGIELSLPVVVLGGAWPYKYELLQAPTGMTIGETLDYSAFATGGFAGDNAAYGIISWSNPTTSGSPHTVEVQVTDQAGSITSVEWTITVTTSNFLFVDSVNGDNGNAGTLASPKQTLGGWYGATKADSTYDGYFIYYRAGTYFTADAPQEEGWRMAVSNTKPVVHLAYPGETANIDVTNNAWNQYSAGGNGFYGGLRWINIQANSDDKSLVLNSGESDSVIFENSFAAPIQAGATSNNAALIFIQEGGNGTNFGIIRSAFEGTNNHDIVLLYGARKGVFEGNTISNNAVGHGFYAKDGGAQQWSVRANRGVTGNTTKFIRFDGYPDTPIDFIEVCWNYWNATAASSNAYSYDWGLEAGPYGTSYWLYRNTWDAPYGEINNMVNGGAAELTRNVIKHSGAFTNGIDIESGAVFTLNYTENLIGTSGMIDASGLLTGADRTTYLGIRGHEPN